MILVGALPFDLPVIAAAAVRFAFFEKDPASPSSRFTSLPDSSKEWVAARRRTDLKTLRTELTGELDLVGMKCLEKYRTRRYETLIAGSPRRFNTVEL